MSYLVVPSDIALLEAKNAIGRQSLGWLESIGLFTMLPVYHNNYTRTTGADLREVLTKKYDPNSHSAEVEICRTRQAAVRRQVISHIDLPLGALTFGALTNWSFRRYNVVSRLVMVPLMAYAGSWVGRFVGDTFSGRNAETYRERFLAGLPAKTYYRGSEGHS